MATKKGSKAKKAATKKAVKKAAAAKPTKVEKVVETSSPIKPNPSMPPTAIKPSTLAKAKPAPKAKLAHRDTPVRERREHQRPLQPATETNIPVGRFPDAAEPGSEFATAPGRFPKE